MISVCIATNLTLLSQDTVTEAGIVITQTSFSEAAGLGRKEIKCYWWRWPPNIRVPSSQLGLWFKSKQPQSWAVGDDTLRACPQARPTLITSTAAALNILYRKGLVMAIWMKGKWRDQYSSWTYVCDKRGSYRDCVFHVVWFRMLLTWHGHCISTPGKETPTSNYSVAHDCSNFDPCIFFSFFFCI